MSQLHHNHEPKGVIPLVVDLDGTLIRTDSLLESIWWLIRHRPSKLLKSLNKLRDGLPAFKEAVAKQALESNWSVPLLPWNHSVIEFLIEQKKLGRPIYLATASNIQIAKAVASHLNIFEGIFASNININLKSEEKANALNKKFGEKRYDYMGNSKDDISPWKHARHALIVYNKKNSRLRWLLVANKITPKVSFCTKGSLIEKWALTLRIKQWTKNLLVFAPMLANHQYLNPQKWEDGLLAFIAFSLCASGAYLLNDLLDIENDRQHKSKKNRLIARGLVSIPQSLCLSIVLPCLGLAVASTTSITGLVLLYYVATIAYSTILKKIAIIDVAILAGLYCLRMIAGGQATGDTVSFWMTAFGAFLFLSLACIKRQAEFINLVQEQTQSNNNFPNEHDVSPLGRGYNIKDMDLTRAMGVATGCIAPLVLALYLENTAAEQFYKHPEYLWGACGLIFIWIMTLWRHTEQGNLKEEDPIAYSLSNPKSLIILALLTLTLALATYLP